ncbi:MAG: hypothetical protein ACRC7H_08975 [Plesiomonas shigelloides]
MSVLMQADRAGHLRHPRHFSYHVMLMRMACDLGDSANTARG